MMKIIIEIEGIEVIINFSFHAIDRLHERRVTEYEVASMILKLGEKILDLQKGKEFAIADYESGVGIICCIDAQDTDIYIDIKTVLNNKTNLFFSKGLKVFSAQEVLSQVEVEAG